jgi:hypothetical protein
VERAGLLYHYRSKEKVRVKDAADNRWNWFGRREALRAGRGTPDTP